MNAKTNRWARCTFGDKYSGPQIRIDSSILDSISYDKGYIIFEKTNYIRNESYSLVKKVNGAIAFNLHFDQIKYSTVYIHFMLNTINYTNRYLGFYLGIVSINGNQITLIHTPACGINRWVDYERLTSKLMNNSPALGKTYVDIIISGYNIQWYWDNKLVYSGMIEPNLNPLTYIIFNDAETYGTPKPGASNFYIDDIFVMFDPPFSGRYTNYNDGYYFLEKELSPYKFYSTNNYVYGGV